MDDAIETSSQTPHELTPEERLAFFKTVHTIVGNNPRGIKEIGANAAGAMDVRDAVELVESSETLELDNVQSGDVIWWRTKNSDNYFRVEDTIDGIKGSFQNFRNDGKDNRSFDEAWLRGAGIRGGMLVPGKLKQNYPVEMALPPNPEKGPEPRAYWSTGVHEMGVIRGEQIQQEQN